jgi:hypothetical protein
VQVKLYDLDSGEIIREVYTQDRGRFAIIGLIGHINPRSNLPRTIQEPPIGVKDARWTDLPQSWFRPNGPTRVWMLVGIGGVMSEVAFAPNRYCSPEDGGFFLNQDVMLLSSVLARDFEASSVFSLFI